jgi:hypothetical protein
MVCTTTTPALSCSATTLHDIPSFFFVRTFTKDAIAGAHKDRCGQRLATTIAGHETRITTSVRGRCSASAATHKAPSRHGALIVDASLYCDVCRVSSLESSRTQK